MSKTTKTDSAVCVLLSHTWKKTPRGSWQRLNSAMSAALRLAIDAGMEFDREDFGRFASEFRSGYWIGDGEWCYSAACRWNPSAAQAYEAWRGRKPFIVHSDIPTRRYPKGGPKARLHVGERFRWHMGFRQFFWVTVTSFCDKPDPKAKGIPKAPYVVAVHHKAKPAEGYSPEKVAMLFRITHDDIKDYHAKIREHLKMNEAQKAAGVEADMVSTAD